MTPVDGRHLADDRLIAVYFSKRNARGRPEAPDSVAGHLFGCDECRRRFDRIAASLDRLRADALAEADAVFTPERLEHQRHRIHRRLTADGRARVISFPASVAGDRWYSTTPRQATRWIAAAASGFLLGLIAGRLVDIPQERSRPVAQTGVVTRLSPQPQEMSAPVSPAPSEVTPDREEAFLSEVHEALYRPSIAELRALDVLTPQGREEPSGIR